MYATKSFKEWGFVLFYGVLIWVCFEGHLELLIVQIQRMMLVVIVWKADVGLVGDHF